MTKKEARPPGDRDADDIENVGVRSPRGRDNVRDEIIEAEPIAATLDDFVDGFDLSNPDGHKSIEGDASYAP